MKKLLNNFVGGLEGENGPHRVSNYEWGPDEFKFRATVHNGIPGSPTCVAYDPLQRLLAIGTKGGFVKIFGKPGIEVVVNQYPNPINHLHFVSNIGRLAIVHNNTICELVNLSTKRSLGNINFGGDKISVVYQLPCSPYLCFGMGSGMICFAESSKATLSTYSITPKHLNTEKPGPVTVMQTHPTDSNILLICHAMGNIVEWSLSKRHVLRKYNVGSALSNTRDLGTLKSACWHPSGKKIIVGYRNGEMLVWQRNKPDYAYKRYIVTTDGNKRPIKKIVWNRLLGHNILTVLGGTSVSRDANVVSIRYQKQITLLPVIGGNESNESIDREMIDFEVCLPSNLPCSSEPKSIITISSISTISVFKADDLGRVLYIPSPPSLQLQSSTITSTLFCSISKPFLNDLMNTSDVSYNAHSWPILGGFASLQPQNCCDILITGHANGMVYFWDISSIQFNLLYAINVANFSQSSDFSIQTVDLCVNSRILAISCKNGETFIFFFRLRPSLLTQSSNVKHTSTAIPQITSRSAISDRIQDQPSSSIPVHSNLNTSNNNNNNYVAVSIPVEVQETNKVQVPVSKPPEPKTKSESDIPTEEKTKSRSKSSKSSSSSSSVSSETKFNWEQFFIAASIDENSAKSYCKQFEDNKITEDLLFELDNDMMEIAGITIAGDKIRILKFIKSCKNDPTLLTPFKANVEKKKKRKKRTDGGESSERRRHRSKKDSDTTSINTSLSSTSPSITSQELPQSSVIIKTEALTSSGGSIGNNNNNNSNNSNNSNNNNNNNNNSIISNSNNGSSLKLSSNANLPANQETKSDVIIEDGAELSGLSLPNYKDGMMPAGYQLKVQYSFKNPISRIRIASSLSKLAVGDVKGNVALVDISTGSILLYKPLGGRNQNPITWLSFDDRVIVEKAGHSKIAEAGLYVGVEDGHIYYVALKTGQVENVPIEQLNNLMNPILSDIKLIDGNGSPVAPAAEEWERLEENSKDAIPNQEEFVVKNLDEMKRKKEKLNKIHGPLTNEDRKYMVVCFDNFIAIFSLPSYQLYSSYECKTRPVTANVAQVDGNSCLVVFLASGDVEILTLMDLQLIASLNSALQKIGVQYNPFSMKDDVNCSLDGRFVVLSKFQEVIRGSLLVHENLLGLPHSIPSLFVPDVPLSDRDIELFETYHADGVQLYSQLFGKFVQSEQRREVDRPIRSTDKKEQQPQSKSSKTSVGEKIVKGVQSGISDVQQVMSENMNMVSLRQERLEELLVSTNKLQSKSSGFAEAASALAAKEKSKK